MNKYTASIKVLPSFKEYNLTLVFEYEARNFKHFKYLLHVRYPGCSILSFYVKRIKGELHGTER